LNKYETKVDLELNLYKKFDQSLVCSISFGILVKSSSSFLSQISSVNIVDQKRTRSVLRIAQVPVEHLHNVQTGIQTNEIGQSQGTHWDIGSEFHRLVDVLFCSNSFVQGVNSFINVWHEESVGDESRDVAGGGCLFRHFCGKSKSYHLKLTLE
jgi:hypothetical protein